MATQTKSMHPASNGRLPEFLTLEEAAAWLRVNPKELASDAESGQFPARRIGGSWRFNRDAILNWFATSAADATTEKERLLRLAGLWQNEPESRELANTLNRPAKKSQRKVNSR